MIGLVKGFILHYNDPMKLEEQIGEALLNQNKTLSIAESCTGGLLSHRLTNVPGSSGYLLSAIICYSNEAKTKLVRVPTQLIEKHGAVSEEVALAMAKGVRTLQNSDFGIGITGIAGPTGGTSQKPIGLTFIAVATAQEELCFKCHFEGSRLEIKKKASTQALNLIKEFLI